MTNEPLTLMCYAPFHSLDIEWYHNGKKLNNTKSTLTIPKEINVTDVIGIYQCFVQDKNFTAIPYHSQQMSSYRLIMKSELNDKMCIISSFTMNLVQVICTLVECTNHDNRTKHVCFANAL